MTPVETQPAQDVCGHSDDDVCHVSCCEDENTALCGTDLSSHEEVDPSHPDPDCHHCASVDATYDCATGPCPVQALRDLLRGAA